jgi:hypothetical protein
MAVPDEYDQRDQCTSNDRGDLASAANRLDQFLPIIPRAEGQPGNQALPGA